MRSLYYMSDELEMTQDLIDYLVQYSVEGGHKSFRYMEEIARSWKEQGITALAVFLFGVLITAICAGISVNKFLRMKAGELYKI